jgi:hypothetical protein
VVDVSLCISAADFVSTRLAVSHHRCASVKQPVLGFGQIKYFQRTSKQLSAKYHRVEDMAEKHTAPDPFGPSC